MVTVQTPEERAHTALQAVVPALEAERERLEGAVQAARVALADLQAERMRVQVRLTAAREALDTWDETRPEGESTEVARAAARQEDEVAAGLRGPLIGHEGYTGAAS